MVRYAWILRRKHLDENVALPFQHVIGEADVMVLLGRSVRISLKELLLVYVFGVWRNV